MTGNGKYDYHNIKLSNFNNVHNFNFAIHCLFMHKNKVSLTMEITFNAVSYIGN